MSVDNGSLRAASSGAASLAWQRVRPEIMEVIALLS